jgi:two-component system, NtrC family, sensor kinase
VVQKMLRTLLIFAITTFVLFFIGEGQNYPIERHKVALANAKDDSTRFLYTDSLFLDYIWSYADSAEPFQQRAFLLAQKLNQKHFSARSYWEIELLNDYTGNYLKAFKAAQKFLELAKQSPDFSDLVYANLAMGECYYGLGDFKNSIFYLKEGILLLDQQAIELSNKNAVQKYPNKNYLPIWERLSRAFNENNQLDSALKYAQLVRDAIPDLANNSGASLLYFDFGNIYLKRKNYNEAVKYYQNGISAAKKYYTAKDITYNFMGLAKAYKDLGLLDSSIYYANKVLSESPQNYFLNQKLVALSLLADNYLLRKNSDSVVKFLTQAAITKDILFSREKMFGIQNLTMDEQARQMELTNQLRQYRENLVLYSIISGLLVILTVAFILWRNNRRLQVQKQETERQKSKVEKTLEELKVAQVQLIQSEKMASLGELTAGIAHEIQNPINFVNNFSEINIELLSETLQAINEDKPVEARKIITDLQANEEKIKFHGQRVDSIVKGMLQHSKTSTGQKISTDINSLAAEYLRLSFHGFRAKDKSFNAGMQTNFDEKAGHVDVVPQDIGKVLLNMYNNAFYAVHEKGLQSGENFKLIVSVRTEKINDKVEISVRDNGNGISAKISDKIFQPFYTTKPPGQGTGLGLSLSYDIVKAYGGEIKVETKEGHFTEFTFRLPAF